jgi:hypothetical protein
VLGIKKTLPKGFEITNHRLLGKEKKECTILYPMLNGI